MVQMNNSDAKFNLYKLCNKVSVTMFDSSKTMNSDMWQSGICGRRWKIHSNILLLWITNYFFYI